MKLFKCASCGQLLYFENFRCERCHHRLGYLPDVAELSPVEQEGGGWRPAAQPGRLWRFCANAEYSVCNWMIPAHAHSRYCAACRHNRTIPDLSQPASLQHWMRLEDAKHRLFYTLMRLGLPLQNRMDDPAHGLTFDFMSDDPSFGASRVMTGHDDGVVTIALEEADDAVREKRRHDMGEPYRTLLGHFRHEVGHYFWDLLVRDGGELESFRVKFGDERIDYAASLERHYRDGPPADWQVHYVSTYASSHPWEDWAESWAHYLHIVDTLEMAYAFGLHVQPTLAEQPAFRATIDFDPHHSHDIGQLINAWLPLCFAMNSLSRAMGHNDLYPFVLSPKVIDKLAYIQNIVARKRDSVNHSSA